jgi:hypothetical protein
MTFSMIHMFGCVHGARLYPSPLYKADENEYDRHDQKDVDKTAHRIGRHKPEQPHDDKD